MSNIYVKLKNESISTVIKQQVYGLILSLLVAIEFTNDYIIKQNISLSRSLPLRLLLRNGSYRMQR